MFELEERYWWFVGRRIIIRTLLNDLLERDATSRPPHRSHSRRILDAGCGTGANMALLDTLGMSFGLDTERIALRFCQERGHRRLLEASVTALPFGDEWFGLVTALDLLEHVDDDRAALAEFRRMLQPNGYLLVTVPAYPALWSEHDEALHHRRRYLAEGLREKIEGAGLRVLKLSYAISAVLPAVFAFRLLQRLLPRRGEAKTAHIQLPRPFNDLLVAYLAFEAQWLRRWRFPCGVSLICLAQKPAAQMLTDNSVVVRVTPSNA